MTLKVHNKDSHKVILNVVCGLQERDLMVLMMKQQHRSFEGVLEQLLQ